MTTYWLCGQEQGIITDLWAHERAGGLALNTPIAASRQQCGYLTYHKAPSRYLDDRSSNIRNITHFIKSYMSQYRHCFPPA